MTQQELHTDDLVGDDPMSDDTESDDAIADQTMGDDEPDQDDDSDVLFTPDDRNSFEERWTEVQTRFVDDPREAVASADNLVAEVMQSLARGFSDHKSSLEDQWSGGGEAETEELRQAMHRYRAFFHRLLAA
jgi:hypothetical protein